MKKTNLLAHRSLSLNQRGMNITRNIYILVSAEHDQSPSSFPADFNLKYHSITTKTIARI